MSQCVEKFVEKHLLLMNSHTIRKVKFLSKNSILTKSEHFHEFFVQNFFDNFSREIKGCQQLKGPKPQHFHEFFTKKIDNFFGKSKLNFWTKNEDFEQCVQVFVFHSSEHGETHEIMH